MTSPFVPGATLKHYRIAALLGKGGMGEVYAAEDTKLGRKVAIKVLPAGLASDPERLRRFTQEAKAASALNHPSILTIHDIDEVDGHPFLVTEFIEGQTLRDRLRMQASPLSLREAVDIAAQVAAALSAAHAAGIVHRDVKPENIMLRDDGHAKLVDFGLAKMDAGAIASTDETVVAVGGTSPGIVMGTTAYMSPEQARGLPVDARSDIFSLGVVLYELAAGRPPFQGDTPSDVLAAILHLDPPAIAGVPSDLEHTLRKALEKDRDERTQTAKDFAAELKRLRRRLDPAAAGASGLLSSARKRPIAAAVTAAALAGIAALVFSRDVRHWLTDDRATGSPAAAQTLQDMTIERVSGLGQVSSPTISGDGKLLAYVKSEGSGNSIWLRQMATGSVVQVVAPTPNTLANVRFTPDGNLLYYSNNTQTRPIQYALMASPAFGGAAREITQGRLGFLSFAPDGKRFVMLREATAAWDVVVMNADGTDASVIATGPKNDPEFASSPFLSPSWSPSGSYIAVIAADLGRDYRTNIKIMRPDGSEVRTLTPSGTPQPILRNLTWADSDDMLVAIGITMPTAPPQVLAIRASDGDVEPITKDVNSYSSLSFSRSSGTIATVQTAQLGSIWVAPTDRPEDATEIPSRLSELDGAGGVSWLNDREIVFTRFSGGPSVWVANADGSSARRLVEGLISLAPKASRDGRTVVFHGGSGKSTVPEVYWMKVADGRITQATHENGAVDGTISRDERTIFFRRISGAPAKLLSTTVDGGPVTTVFEAATIFDYDLSPDGSRIAVTSNAGTGMPRTVSLVPAGGGDARAIFTTSAALVNVLWYSSGNALLVLIGENRQVNMYRLDVAGGPPRQLTNFTRGALGEPTISPDGRRIAYFRGTTESDIVLLKPTTRP